MEGLSFCCPLMVVVGGQKTQVVARGRLALKMLMAAEQVNHMVDGDKHGRKMEHVADKAQENTSM